MLIVKTLFPIQHLVIVRDVQSGVVGDDVVVDGEDGLGVRLDPRHLDIMLQS